jgi:hypothetical protein
MFRQVATFVTIVTVITGIVFSPSLAQEVTSVQSGPWNASATWDGGIIPHSGNTERIIVAHHVTIPDGFGVAVDELLINDSLSIASGGTLTLLNGPSAFDLLVDGTWIVDGTFAHEDDAVVSGTTPSNSWFRKSASYFYRWNTAGALPVVRWDSTATFYVTAFNTNSSVTSDTWTQNFGNFIYDCAAQGNFMDFNGRLRNVQGNLFIRSTNNKICRLARGQSYTLTVGGTFAISGTSEVWLGENAGAVNVVVRRNFEFNAQATASSYLTLTGSTTLTIGENFILDTSYKIKFASSGGGRSVMRVGGDVRLLSGTIDALGSGRASILFEGDSVQHYERTPGAFVEGHFQYSLAAPSTLNVGESLLYNTTGGAFDVFGKLIAGSSNSTGAIQAGLGSNTSLVDGLLFHPGSVVEYSAVAPQFVNAVPTLWNADVVVINPGNVTVIQDLAVHSFRIASGEVDAANNSITISGDFTVEPGAIFRCEGEIICNGSADQEISANGSGIPDLTINGSARQIRIMSSTNISGVVAFSGAMNSLVTNDMLILRSSSLDGGGGIGPLLNGNTVLGKVTVQRFMPVGRAYRYISIPVSGESVAGLMDDFPITGSFDDPSTGPGISSTTPSFFYFDGSLEGWRNYPSAGVAQMNILSAGRGYSAFVRDNVTPVVWDVHGEINQGEMTLPVSAPGAGAGWNLVGNPFPCAVRWDNPGWSKQNISSGIAVRDNTEGSFRIWDGAVGDLDDGVIALGQAFWVRATGENPELVISEAAKQIAPATFYRKGGEVDFITIEVRQGDRTDRAYLRRREGSKQELDPFDIPKLMGDNVSVFIVTDGGDRLALSAESKFDCEHAVKMEIITPHTTDSVYVKISSFGLFKHSQIFLKNAATSDMISVAADGSYVLPPAPSSSLMLIVGSSREENGVITLPEFICEDRPVVTHITDFSSRYRYTLIEFADSATQREYEFDRNSTTFIFHDGMRYRLKQENACHSLENEIPVSVKLPDPPLPVNGARCGDGPVTLNVLPRDGIHFEWYSPDGALLASGESFETPYLEKSAVFEVRSVDVSSSCRSVPEKISAQIIRQDSLLLKRHGRTLVASVPPPLEWYRGTEKLLETDSALRLRGAGVYRAIKTGDTGFCMSDGVYHYWDPYIAVYPNPASDYLLYQPMGGNAILKDILSVNGASVFYLCRLVCTPGECRLDIRSLSAGTYFLIFAYEGIFFKTSFSVY